MAACQPHIYAMYAEIFARREFSPMRVVSEFSAIFFLARSIHPLLPGGTSRGCTKFGELFSQRKFRRILYTVYCIKGRRVPLSTLDCRPIARRVRGFDRTPLSISLVGQNLSGSLTRETTFRYYKHTRA